MSKAEAGASQTVNPAAATLTAATLTIDVEKQTGTLVNGGTTVDIDFTAGVAVRSEAKMQLTDANGAGLSFGDDVVVHTNGAVKVEPAAAATGDSARQADIRVDVEKKTGTIRLGDTSVMVDMQAGTIAVQTPEPVIAAAGASATLGDTLVLQTNGAVSLNEETDAAPAEAPLAAPLAIAQKMEDGSYYIGRSPATHKDMFITPSGQGFFMTHDKATDEIRKLNKDKYLGHGDWVMPDIQELGVIWNNAEVGMLRKTFNFTTPTQPGNKPGAFYWSSTPEGPDNFGKFWHKRITDGFQTDVYGWSENNKSSLRGIRYEDVDYTPGDEMPDGSVYVGDSPKTGRKMFMMPGPLDIANNFNAAAALVAQANQDKALGHGDWQIPSRAEWKVIEDNKNKGLLGKANLAEGVDETQGWVWQKTWRGGTNKWSAAAKRDGDEHKRKHYSVVKAIRLV